MIFHVTLERAEDGWIVAECPALPGCVFQGKDEEEALENIKEGMQTAMGLRASNVKQRNAAENAILSGRLGLEKLRGLQDIRQQQMAANKEGKIAGLIGQREKQLESYAKDLVIKTGLMIDTEEGQKAIANKLAELRSGDDFLAKLYKEYGLPAIKSTPGTQNLAGKAQERLKNWRSG